MVGGERFEVVVVDGSVNSRLWKFSLMDNEM